MGYERGVKPNIVAVLCALVPVVALAGCGDAEPQETVVVTSTTMVSPSTQAPSTQATSTQATPPSDVPPAAASEAGRTRLTGTVRSISAEEALNGYPAYEGIDWDQRYTVFDLDQPTEVRGVIAGNPNYSQTVTRVVLDGAEWDQRAGEHLTVSVPQGAFRFPSGADLPIGTPHVEGARVV